MINEQRLHCRAHIEWLLPSAAGQADALREAGHIRAADLADELIHRTDKLHGQYQYEFRRTEDFELTVLEELVRVCLSELFSIHEKFSVPLERMDAIYELSIRSLEFMSWR